VQIQSNMDQRSGRVSKSAKYFNYLDSIQIMRCESRVVECMKVSTAAPWVTCVDIANVQHVSPCGQHYMPSR
jgi:hypothetical protein